MINAIKYYFDNQEKSVWFRQSTQEWVIEIDITVPNEFCLTSRYSHKYKLLAHLRYVFTCMKDVRRINNVL